MTAVEIFQGAGQGQWPMAAALSGLTRLDLSQSRVCSTAADAAALIRACPALRSLATPDVKAAGA